MVDKRKGFIPDGQTSRGTPVIDAKNPKNASARRRDGVMPDTGDSGQVQRSKTAASTGYGSDVGPSTFDRGNPGSVPDPARINTAYRVDDGSTPATENVSDYRSYSIPPGDVAQPDGDTRDSVRRPTFGKGTD
jgi:hypothetical protein